MGVSFPNDNESTQFCVNVGKRVRSFQLGTSTPSDMQKQTVDGAQWIPAYLLEIFPFQPMGGLMSPDHTTEMMKVALHLPAENAALIDQEGLEMLDVRSQSQGHVSLVSLDSYTTLSRSNFDFLAKPGIQARHELDLVGCQVDTNAHIALREARCRNNHPTYEER
jgi:hypothetical protein